MNWTTHPTHRTATPTQQRNWAKKILQRDKTCQINGPNCTGKATEADHITNIANGGNELDPNNGQGLCHNCHQQKTQHEAHQAQNNWKRKQEPHPGLK